MYEIIQNSIRMQKKVGKNCYLNTFIRILYKTESNK